MIISVVNHKGGTGKTASTSNVGSALALMNYKVLLIDLDPQGNLSYSFGISDDTLSIYEVFTGENSIEDVIVRKEGLDILPSNIRLSDIELSLHSTDNRTAILKEMLSSYRSKYDFIIIDCPPSKSLLSINALVASEKVIATILLDVLSVQGLNHIIRTVSEIKEVLNNDLTFLGVLAVNVDMRKNISGEVIQFIKENFDVSLFKCYIRTNVKIAEAPSHGESVLKYASTSNGAKDYKSLAVEIIKLNS